MGGLRALHLPFVGVQNKALQRLSPHRVLIPLLHPLLLDPCTRGMRRRLPAPSPPTPHHDTTLLHSFWVLMSIFFQAVPCYAKGAAPKQAVLWGEWAAVAVASLNDAVLSQLVQLQVAEGFPRADHGDIWGEKRLRQHKTHPGSSGCPRRAPCCPNRFGIGTPYLFPALPCPGCHRRTCKESEAQSPPDPCHAGTPIRVPAWGPAARPHSPLHPLLGWLALELPRLPLLEFGGSFPGGGGSPGHPGGRLDLRFVGLQAHGCAGASSLPRVAAVPAAPVLARDGSSDLLEGRFGAWGAPAAAPSPSPTSEGPHGAFGVLPPCPEPPLAVVDQLSVLTLGESPLRAPFVPTTWN